MNGKQSKIDAFLKEPIKVGDTLEIKGFGSRNENWFGMAEVVEIVDGIPLVMKYGRTLTPVLEEYRKYTGYVGADPFKGDSRRVQNINFSLESILHVLYKEEKYSVGNTLIKASNDNPYVFLDGVKKYYQRPLVWKLEDKQRLLDSIYNGAFCGSIMVRNRGWKELEQLEKEGHELAWKDIVDGKQRLNAVKTFIEGEFSDSHGNFYKDLSVQAQRKLVKGQLFNYSEIIEDSSDEEVLEQFLKLNFSGVVQSEEHLDYVKGLCKNK